MQWGKRFVDLLVVLMVVGSAITPAMAVGIRETGSNNACVGKPEFAVIDVKGLEKSLTLSDVLKSKEVEAIREFAHKNGYKLDLSKQESAR